MNIAKPPDGFKIKISPEAKTVAYALGKQYVGFSDQWGGLKDRLKMVGHRGDSIPSSGEIGNFFAVEVEAVEPGRSPAFVVVYKILGETLTICAVRET
jgi:hypothetical protein